MPTKTIPQLYGDNPIAAPALTALLELSQAGVPGAATVQALANAVLGTLSFALVKKISGDQSMTAMDHIKVTMSTVVTDSDGYWTPASNCFTIPAGRAGLYVVLGQVQWRPYSASDGYRFIDMLNSTGGITGNVSWPDNKVSVPAGGYHDGETRQQVLAFGVFAAGDTIALYAEQDNAAGASVDVQGYNTWFAIIGPFGSGT